MKKTVKIEGQEIVYDEFGDSKNLPIIMIHGWLSYRGVWKDMAESLKEKYYCIAVDLLGFGESDKPGEADYSIEAQGKRVVEIADMLGLDRFALIAHSMGGQIAMNIASDMFPERVERLVNVGGTITGKLGPYNEKVTIRFTDVARHIPKLYSMGRGMFRYEFFVREIFKTWFYQIEKVPREVWEKDREMAFQEEANISANEAGRAMQRTNIESKLPKIIAPTLIIFGDKDEVVPVSEGDLANQKILNSRFEIIEECGHYPMYEKAEEFERIVLEFFST